MSARSEIRAKFIKVLTATGKSTITAAEINELCAKNKINKPYWFLNDENNRFSRGVYKVPFTETKTENVVNLSAQVLPMTKPDNTPKITSMVTSLDGNDNIPEVYKNYVPFGHFQDLLSIFESKQFYPIFISGHSGNGKTMSVEQACAKLKRKFICVSMTPDTDESDLLGNFVLINGEMVWRDGPVTTAARQGAVLCLDEIDYGAQNLSTLQRVLEGKPFLLKKKSEWITPAEGFTVVATANTKGKGSEDGRYMFTNVLNEAFLERFLNTFEQEWPPAVVEKKILRKEVGSNDKFADNLVAWADVIRKSFAENATDEVISTRRLVHIAKTYKVFKDEMKAINLCLNRFDEDTRLGFLDLYSKLVAPPAPVAPEGEVKSEAGVNQEVPF